jgi:DNA-binding NtrC family response regulator
MPQELSPPDDAVDQAVTVVQGEATTEPPREGIYLLAVVEGGNKGQSFEVDGAHASPLLVGQSPACEVRLNDPQVSRRHASLELRDGKLRLRDLGSTNGTWVDRVQVGEAILRGDERLRVGSTVFHVEWRPTTERPRLPQGERFGRALGTSPQMRKLYPLCARLAAADVPVIIEGETGTGKEVLAESLHEEGRRSGGPFVVFDCTAVPANLVESELFGHERGAFTGAVATRRGLFEQAQHGTLLIDEIGDLDLALQPKLLRAIERGEVRRVGGDRWTRVDVRVLSATRRDLDHEVQVGRFRDDLFHRLAVARIELPPLRERHGDIAMLAKHFWAELGGGPEGLGAGVLARWQDYAWPGNVRELRNAVSRQLALGELADEPGHVSQNKAHGGDAIARVLNLPFIAARDHLLEEFEQRYVARLLEQHDGDVARAAAASGIGRRYFQKLRARAAK